jgi:hypothetical protein
VAGDVLGGLDLAQQFGGVAADAAGVISTIWILPCGSTTKVPRSARPASSIITPKLRVPPVGSPIIGYWILPMVSEVSCQALWVKCVSVETL